MKKDKYEFILDLIDSNKLNQFQKEKVLKLAANEIKSEKNKDSDLINRLNKIEAKLVSLNFNQNNKSTSLPPVNMPGADPRHVADFMSLFNQRDGLKYLTHDYDENEDFNIDEFLISANNIFKEATKQLNIPPSLWRIVKQFAFDSKQTEWSSISEDYKRNIIIKTGWATKKLRNWSKENQLHPLRNDEYCKIINDFKRVTRIETPSLTTIINNSLGSIFKDELESYIIKIVDTSKADFYSHVVFLKNVLEIIFEEIKKYSNSAEKKKISIEYLRSTDDNYFLRKIEITHHNSFPIKELKLILNEWHEKGNMGKIKEKLKGYCFWSIETLIESEPIRVNLLKDKETPNYEKIDYSPDGFKHILTFYYK